MASLYYNSNIYKITIYPFGGYIQFNDKLNRPLKEDFIILISGPLLQIAYFYFLSLLGYIDLIRPSTFNIIINYHYSLLFFNLLPIYPLDGSKLVNILFSKFMSFKQSHIIMIYVSYATLFICLLCLKYISINVNIYLLLILIATKLVSESRNHKSIYNRFLLERYLYDFYFKTVKIVKGNKLSKMMRDKRHIFLINSKSVTEKYLLKKRYDKNNL